MTDSYIFTGTGFVTGKYRVTNNEIYSSVKKGLLEGFNEARIESSESFQEAKRDNLDLNAFDYMVDLKMGFRDRFHVVPFPPADKAYKNAETSLDLVVKAIQEALDKAGLSGKQIDAWYVGTATPNQHAPGIAEFSKAFFTDADNCSPTYSLTSACVGFNINVENALTYFESNPEIKHIVVAHSEIMSKLLTNEGDFVPFATFGDSAAAVVISRVKTKEKCGIIASVNGEDTAMLDFLGANIKGHLYMDARRVKSRAVPNIVETIKQLMDKCDWNDSDVDWYIPHQTGNAIVHSVRDILEIDAKKLFQEVQYNYGNLSGASVPASIFILEESNRLKPGNKIITSVAGLGGEFGGFAYVVPQDKTEFSHIPELMGKQVLITGATGAIGSKIAYLAAKQGANLILHYNSNHLLANKIKNEIIANYGVKTELWQADLTNANEIKSFVSSLQKSTNNINFLIVTHAITGGLSKASKVSIEEFSQVMAANYQSVKLLCDSIGEFITETVLITGSVGEDAQFSGSSPYVSSKRALRGYAVNLASELYNKRVNCVYYLPGLIDDGMIADLDISQVNASMMSVAQQKLIDSNSIADRMLKSVYRLKIAEVRISYESKLKVIKDGYLKF
jgi:3-oxoacyl-[acyl-carrier-protein] synthase-3